ncbi:MAG: DPP IV N-terminal domain-containing protein [Sphingomonas sp.]
MKIAVNWRALSIAAAAVALVPTAWPASAPAQALAQAPEALPIDMLYSIPSIIGTSPEGYVWSPDGTEVAFLWNDEGRRFRDLWVYSTVTGQKRRLTSHASQAPADTWAQGIAQAAWVPGPGKRLAYVLGGKAYLVEDGGSPKPVAEALKAVRQLTLSPDGRHLALVNGGPTDRNSHMFLPGGGLWVIDLAAAELAPPREIVAGGERLYIDRYEWSADGRSIAFVQGDESGVPFYDLHYALDGEPKVERISRPFPGDPTRKYRVGVIAAGGEPRWMARSNERDPVWNFGLSSDGRSLFVNASDFLIKHHSVLVYDVASGKATTYFDELDPKRSEQNWQVEWAPGDKGLVILTDIDGYDQLYHQATPGGRPRRITTGKWDIESFTVDGARGQIHFVSDEPHVAERQFYRVAIGGGRITRLSAVAGTHAPVYSPDFRYAADRFSNDQTPPELYLADLRGTKPAVPVTKSPLPAFYQQKWAQVEYVEFPSHIDGAPLIGRVTLPRDYDPAKKYPMIVGSVYRDTVRNQWGGRTSHPVWGPRPESRGARLYPAQRERPQQLRPGQGAFAGAQRLWRHRCRGSRKRRPLHGRAGKGRSRARRHLGIELWRPADADLAVPQARSLCGRDRRRPRQQRLARRAGADARDGRTQRRRLSRPLRASVRALFRRRADQAADDDPGHQGPHRALCRHAGAGAEADQERQELRGGADPRQRSQLGHAQPGGYTLLVQEDDRVLRSLPEAGAGERAGQVSQPAETGGSRASQTTMRQFSSSSSLARPISVQRHERLAPLPPRRRRRLAFGATRCAGRECGPPSGSRLPPAARPQLPAHELRFRPGTPPRGPLGRIYIGFELSSGTKSFPGSPGV